MRTAAHIMAACAASVALGLLIRGAHAEWERSGGPADCRRQRTAFVLRLCQIGLQHLLQLQLHTVPPMPPAAPAAQHLAPPPRDGVPKVEAAQASLDKLHPAPGGIGFRRLRRGFASAEDCRRLRAATTVAMVHAISRGGQTVLSPGPERDMALGLSSDAGAAGCLQLLLERIRVAATNDLNRSSAAASASAAAASPPAAAAAAGSRGPDAGPTAGAWQLSLCGDLIVRLEPPEPIDAPEAALVSQTQIAIHGCHTPRAIPTSQTPTAHHTSQTFSAQEAARASSDGGRFQPGIRQATQTENGHPFKAENGHAAKTENRHGSKTENGPPFATENGRAPANDNRHPSAVETPHPSPADGRPPAPVGNVSAAGLSSRSRAAGCWRLAPRQPYWDPHVDQHNASAYHVSAVLYMASGEEEAGGSPGNDAGGMAGQEITASSAAREAGHVSAPTCSPAVCVSPGGAPCFRGGVFSFHDADADVVLGPEEGSLLTFSSGGENPHSVGRVEAGCRFALVTWFTQVWVAERRRGGGEPAEAAPAEASALHEEGEEESLAVAGTVEAAGLAAVKVDPVAAVAGVGAVTPLNAELCAPLSRLISGGEEAALRLAAGCCLAGNDPARGALLGADGSGRTVVAAMERLMREEGGHGAACLPTAWAQGLGIGAAGPAAGSSPECGSTAVALSRCPEPVLGCEDQLAALLGPDASHPLLAAMGAAVRSRVAALVAAQASARGATAADAMFDVFD
eukprot:scaffold13523_cov92-Isochrysis_galbana.AAC.3